MERDEITVIYQLRQLGSMAAGIIIQLQFARGAIQEAFSHLQHDRPARITMASVLSTTRFRLHYRGRTLNTVCGRRKESPDSFEHLLECYELHGQVRVGPEATDFLALMAVRAKLSPPGVDCVGSAKF